MVGGDMDRVELVYRVLLGLEWDILNVRVKSDFPITFDRVTNY